MVLQGAAGIGGLFVVQLGKDDVAQFFRIVMGNGFEFDAQTELAFPQTRHRTDLPHQGERIVQTDMSGTGQIDDNQPAQKACVQWKIMVGLYGHAALAYIQGLRLVFTAPQEFADKPGALDAVDNRKRQPDALVTPSFQPVTRYHLALPKQKNHGPGYASPFFRGFERLTTQPPHKV